MIRLKRIESSEEKEFFLPHAQVNVSRLSLIFKVIYYLKNIKLKINVNI